MGEPAKTEGPAPKVKIKMVRDAMVGKTFAKAGTVVEATEEEAKDLCDHKFRGYIPFYGNKPTIILEENQVDPLARKSIVRAVRVG